MPALAKKLAQQAEKDAWDPDDLPDFEVLEDGDYAFRLLSCVTSDAPGKSGYHYWKWVFEHDASKVRIFENTSLSPQSLGKIGQIMGAFGVPADTDTDLLIGQYVGVSVEQVLQEQGKRKGKPVNNGLAFFPVEELDEYDPDVHGPKAAGGGRAASVADFGGEEEEEVPDDSPPPTPAKRAGKRAAPTSKGVSPSEEPF